MGFLVMPVQVNCTCDREHIVEFNHVAELIWPTTEVCKDKTGMTRQTMNALNNHMMKTFQSGKSKYVQRATDLYKKKRRYRGRQGWAIKGIEKLIPQKDKKTCLLVHNSFLCRIENITANLADNAGFLCLHSLRNAPLGAVLCVSTDMPAYELVNHSKGLGASVMEALNKHNIRTAHHKIFVLQINEWSCVDKTSFLDGMTSKYCSRSSIQRVEAAELPFAEMKHK